jgi:Flp pilus assembly protein TadD
MTWYEIVLLVICGGSLALVVYRLVIKFPLAARVDVANMPETKQQSVKKLMLEQRLRRLVLGRTKIIRQKSGVILKVLKNILVVLYHDLLEKEKELINKRRQASSVVAVGERSLMQRLENLLSEAQMHLKKDEYSSAEKKYLEVISLDPKNVEAFEGLGDMYLTLRKYEEAKEVFTYLLKLTSAQSYFYDKLGKVAKTQGHLQEAESQFRLSVETNNQNASYMSDLAEVYEMEEEFDKAADYLEQAVAIEPHNPKYLDALLNISIIRKDKVRALQIMNILAEVNPENQKLASWKEQIESL